MGYDWYDGLRLSWGKPPNIFCAGAGRRPSLVVYGRPAPKGPGTLVESQPHKGGRAQAVKKTSSGGKKRRQVK